MEYSKLYFGLCQICIILAIFSDNQTAKLVLLGYGLFMAILAVINQKMEHELQDKTDLLDWKINKTIILSLLKIIKILRKEEDKKDKNK